MNRFFKISLWISSSLIGFVFIAILGVFIGINTPIGQHLIEKKLPSLTSDMVRVEGVSGVLPWHLSLKHASIQDEKGTWLSLEKADLRLSLLSLLKKNIRIVNLSAENLNVLRKPVSSAPPSPPSDKKMSLPGLGVQVDHLELSKLDIGSDIIGQPLSLSIFGRANVKNIAAWTSGIQLDHIPNIALELDIHRLDSAAHFHLHLNQKNYFTDGNINFEENEGGFISTIAKMPVLDPFSLNVNFHGPSHALAISTGLSAGKIPDSALKSTLKATLDLARMRGDISINASAPKMTLNPTISWQGIDLTTNLHGSLKTPSGDGHLIVKGISASGSGAQSIHVNFNGHDEVGKLPQEINITSKIDGLRIPGKDPNLFAASPMMINASFLPSDINRSFSLNIEHTLAQIHAKGRMIPSLAGHVVLDLPYLEGLSGALGGTKLNGHTHLETDFALPESKASPLTAQITGAVAITGGQAQATNLIGKEGKILLRAQKTSDNVVHLDEVKIDGKSLHLEGKATLDQNKSLQSDFHLQLTDLKQAYPILRGNSTLDIGVVGPLTDLSTKANLHSVIGLQRPGTVIKESPISLELQVDHLPSSPEGYIHLQGEFDRSPMLMHAGFQRDKNGNIKLKIDDLNWKTIQGHGDVRLPSGQKIPKGDLDITIKNLQAFRSLVGKPISGHLALGMHTQLEPSSEGKSEQDNLKLNFDSALSMADYSVKNMSIKGNVSHLPNDPYANIKILINGLKVQKILGNIQAQIVGPQSALSLVVKGDFNHLLDAPAHLNASLLENILDKKLTIKSLSADVKGEYLQLMSPSTVQYGKVTGVDRLRLSVKAGRSGIPAIVDVAGELKPNLNATASIEHITPSLGAPFVPSLKADGLVSLHAAVRGTLAEPTGKITLDGKNLHMRNGPGNSLPPASFYIETNLQGKKAVLQSHVEAGHGLLLQAQGVVPLKPEEKFSLTAKGKMDLILANALLGASGMGVAGQVSLNMGADGTLKQPKISGQVALRNGSFDHYAQGVHLTNITGDINAEGDTIRIQNLLIHAGTGTMNLTGTIGAFVPGMPIDLKFIMDKAQPVRSDMLEETLNSQIHIFGQATTRLDVEGNVKIPQASINIPDSMPASVPELEIITPETEKKKSSAPSSLIIGLNVDVTSPGKIFVRGHGLFAEMQANLNVGGTSKAPSITGGVDLRRGNFNLAGISLNFTQGRVGFNGTGVTNKLDPTIDFRADRNAHGTLASLLVSGHASAPKFDFVSSPSLSRDEVLSILLFGESRASLSTTQLAQLGAAVVQISGGSAFDPLGKVRNTLGLDHLGIGGGSGTTSVEAGKYVMKGVYVGAKEGLSGKGAQAQVRIDLTKNLKLNTTVGTGGQVTGFTTPENDPGSSVGLSYGIDY